MVGNRGEGSELKVTEMKGSKLKVTEVKESEWEVIFLN